MKYMLKPAILVFLVLIATQCAARAQAYTFQNETIEGPENSGYLLTGFVPADFSEIVEENQLRVASGGIVSGGDLGAARTKHYQHVVMNRVIILGGRVVSSVPNVYAGWTRTGNATKNWVQIEGGEVDAGAIYAGRSVEAGAVYNWIAVTGGTVRSDFIYGGWGGAVVEENSVSISGGKLENGTAPRIYGGYSHAGNADRNTVSITAGAADVPLYISGGEGMAGASSNEVKVSGFSGEFMDIVGGDIRVGGNGPAGQNKVELRGVTVTGGVFGGRIDLTGNGTADGNRVDVYNTTVNDGIIGGSGPDGASRNTVTESGSTPESLGEILGGNATTGDAKDNVVRINDGTIHNTVYGGWSSSGDATRNDVSIFRGNITNHVSGGYSDSGQATHNAVTIFGGNLADVAGGRSDTTGRATYNTVTFHDGTVQDIYGGYSQNGGPNSTTNNTVTLIGGTITGKVLGGNNDKTGNTLNLHGYHGTVGEINNFANYSVILPDSVANGGTMVQVTGPATDLNGARVTDFSFAPGANHYEGQVSVKIIGKVVDTGGTFAPVAFKAVPKGPTATYDVEIAMDGGALVTNIEGKKTGGHSQNTNESRYADIALLSKSSFLLARAGLDRAWQDRPCTPGSTVSVFGVSDYNDFRIDGGMDMHGWSLLTGLGWRNRRECDYGLLLGAFFETGRASYDGARTYAAGRVKYSGSTEYHGGGLLARYRFANGLRLDASFRAGWQEMEYPTTRYPGVALAEYELGSEYGGLHGAIGYDLSFADRWNLDVAAMYQWLRLGGDSAKILGEKVKFDSIRSHVARVGGRLGYAVTPRVKPFVGAYYEYEFDGRSRSYNRTAKLATRSYKASGGPGLGELGVGFVRSRNRDLLIEVAAKGSVGKNEGFGGQINFNLNF